MLKFGQKYCFELVGYDFMLINAPSSTPESPDFDVRLIEANTNPSIEESNELLRQLVPRMLDDLFKITLDSVFFKAEEVHLVQEKSPLFPVKGYGNREQMWSQIH